MAHNGRWLVKVGTFEIPLSLIKYGTYKTAPAQRQDNGAYVDADGYLHRAPMPHTRSKIEFETIFLSVKDFDDFQAAIVANYINGLEKKVHLTYYEEEYGQYVEGDFYLAATQEYPMLTKNLYDNIRWAFIEY
jgi:hypothetical protein